MWLTNEWGVKQKKRKRKAMIEDVGVSIYISLGKSDCASYLINTSGLKGIFRWKVNLSFVIGQFRYKLDAFLHFNSIEF